MHQQIVLVDFKPKHALKLQISSEEKGRLINMYFNDWSKLVQVGPAYIELGKT